MGQSTDAILFYGYCWDDELPARALFDPSWDEDEEDEDHDTTWAEFVALKRGVTNPWASFPPELNNWREHGLTYEEKEIRVKQWIDEHDAELDARRDAIKAIEAEFGCDIGWHCSSDYGMPYIFVKESEITASRGNPQKLVSIDELFNDETAGLWDEKLSAFVAELGCASRLPQRHPGWWLVSYWTY